jgi:glycosyltransferase involved in cell wall biosynthesis
VSIDRELLAERWELRDWRQPGRWPNLPKLIPAVLRSDLVFAWFASWHSFFPITFAWLLRKPSVLVIGGFDTANMPDIGYGYQQGGIAKWASRWIMSRATRLVTNSYYSQREIRENIGLAPGRVTVVQHGLPDRFGPLSDEPRERSALTVGHLSQLTLGYKGHRTFVEAAALLPDVQFRFVGNWEDEAIEELRSMAPQNVTFTGWLPDADRDALLKRSAVYVQPSRHEGFGIALAEAMLAGCVPVAINSTAMPEVMGDAGILVDSPTPELVAEGVREALGASSGARERARQRILHEFPLANRRAGLHAVVQDACEAR